MIPTNPHLPKALLSALAVASLSLTALTATAQRPQPRLTAPINNSVRVTLAGSQPPRVRMARDLGAVDGSMQLSSMTLVFRRSAAQQAALDALIAAQQDPSSPQYHLWLTPTEFGARFGMADADLSKAEDWLQSQGFTVLSVSPSRDRITFSGSAASVASAFGAPLHHYSLNGQTHLAPSADLTLPAAFSGVVEAVTNLSDFRPHPHVRYASVVHPRYTSSQTGNHFLTPLDVATIYDISPAYTAGFNGSGQSIAIVGQSDIVTTDITNFQSALGQTPRPPTLRLVPNTGSSEISTGDESESDLDLEYTSAIAPGASIYFVYTGSDHNYSVFDALNYAIQNNIAPIINISYGDCEPDLGQTEYNSMDSNLQQAATQGQTVVSASGDDGSTDCYGEDLSTATQEGLAVDFPSSSQYVTGVGGTEFPAAAVLSGNNTYFQAAPSSDVVSSALAYIPETAWNDDSSAYPDDPLASGGGGASIFTARPAWQTGVPGIPSGSFRLVPDVAFDASSSNAPYAYCSSDQTAWASDQTSSCSSGLRDSSSQDLTIAGGTSFAAPIFAGMVAILNQARGYTAQGLVNPELYTLASNNTLYASAFHDITTGSNACDIGSEFCSTAGAASFSTTAGYDQATGLGSIDFYNLLAVWPQSGQTAATAPSFTVTATAVSVTSGDTATSTVTVTPLNGYTGTVNWSIAPATLSGVCYTLPSVNVTGSTPVTATLTLTTGSSTCASGTAPLLRPGTAAAALHRPAPPSHPSHPTVPVTFAALGLFSLGLLGRRRLRHLPALLAIVLLIGAGFGLSGCGGGTSATTGGGGGGGGGGTTPTSTTDYAITLIGTDSAHSAITAKGTLTLALTTTN